MVGVPGRSKSCITCRKRRKGCDLEKPACGQCRKGGLTCGGYSTERIFVVSTPRNRHAGYSAPSTAAPASLPWQRIQHHQVSSNITNLRLLARPEDERRCIDHFWETYFPAGQPIPRSAARSYTCTWTETARSFNRDDGCLRYALWANCLVVTGRHNGVAWMLREGSRLYGEALADLRKSLAGTRGPGKGALIATIKLLGMFETFSTAGNDLAADQPQNWQRHHAGELALFITRTAEAHIDGEAHHVFADERVEMALSAILQRKRLVLGAPEWKSVPWQRIPKDFKDILVDVLVDMPGLVEDLDSMGLCADASRRAALQVEVEQKCWEHDRQLLVWLRMLSQMAVPSKQPCREPRAEDLVVHIAQVHGMSLFWTTSLVLYSILRLVSGAGEGLPARTDPMHYARNLATSLGILLQPNAGLYGQQSAALPLEIALQYTRGISTPSPESGALLETLQRLKDNLVNGPTRVLGVNSVHQGATSREMGIP
ncbi:uncharacterized protein B0H64DRAFT_7105 [Chaetomium fimeti]|uniref:Zn(2)-C6 fungal-type domain-containing protein n=1 Tax=Chaetomium fimeti TaxID=1854472 RepID=A0AAE0LWL4_9PEZI|nr:hypothetical protein B0H64DRAFT_7105 [Chaetomium fimeti]